MKLNYKLTLGLLCAMVLGNKAFSQAYSMVTASGTYTQDFNTLPTTGTTTVWADNSNIANWYSQRTGTGNTIAATAGTATGGNLYSFGTGTTTERAIGALGSSNATAGSFAHGVQLQNNTGAIVTSMNIDYVGEQWRNSGAGNVNTITLWYKVSASAITALTPNTNTGWTQITGIDFSSPINSGAAGALDGDLAANRTALTGSISGVNVPDGSFIMIKWEDPDHTGTDHGLGIDDVSITWNTTAPCTPPSTQASVFASSSITNSSATISWTAGNGGNAIVLIHQSSSVNTDPTSGSTYTANSVYSLGTQLGTGNYVVYDGTGTSVTVTGLNSGTTYFFAVYEYDPNGGSPCYNLVELAGSITTTGTPATCFEIESILVDGCDGGNEGQNEMVRFKVGNTPLNVADLTVNWPSNPYLNICQDATTANGVATINSTILGCGFVKEPIAGILPAGAEVILVTSTLFNPLAQSFQNLNDTIYMIFQCAGNTLGHFGNYSSGTGIRTLSMTFSNPASCTDVVSYDKSLLTMQNGNIGGQDGGAVEFDPAGTATYVNRGCQAPFVPLDIEAGADVSVCFNGTVSLSGSTSSQYTSLAWSGGTGVFSAPGSLATNYTPGVAETSGTIKIYLQLNTSCGSFIRDSLIITINPAPTPTVTADIASATVCNGSPITLTASGGTSYLWNTTATTNTITVNPTTSTEYTVDVTNSCSTTQATFSVTVNDLPVINATNSGAYCAKDSIHLSETLTTGFSYSWAGPNSFSSSIQNPFIANASTADAGTYSLTVTDNNTCQNTTTTTVVINALPTFNSTGLTITPATCGLADGDISGVGATGTNGTNYTYYWTASNGGIITPMDSILTDTTGGVYYLVATEIATGCKDSTSFTIPTLGGPTIPVFAAINPVCEGTGATLSLTPGSITVGATYIWTLGTDTLQNGVDLTSLVLDTATAGPYNVTVISGGCGNSADTTITIKTKPIPTITGTLSFCAGTNTVLDASTSSPSTGNTYQWYLNGSPIGGETAATYSATTAGNYQVMVTNTGCDSLSAVTTVSVNALPVVNVTLSPVVNTDAGCGLTNGSITLASASGSAPFTYQWTNGSGTSLSSDSTLLNVGAGTYYLVAIDANGCKDSSSTTVNATLPPAAATFDQAPSVCEGSTFSLSVNNDLAGATYSWAATGVPTQTGVDLTSITVSDASSVNVGVYTVSVTVDACVATSTVSATFNPRPDPQITSDSSAMCTGNFIVLDGNPTSGVSYQWLLNASNIAGATASTFSANQPGNYSLYVLDLNGCDSTSASFAITVHPEPVISSNDDQFCLNSSIAGLTASSSDPNIVYSWNNGAGTGSTFPVNSLTVGATTYTVVGVDQNGCDDTVTVVATILANPVFGFSANDFCLGVAGTLSTDNSNLTYSWDNGTISSGNSVSVPASSAGSTTYTVTGTDGNGCETVNTINAVVHDLPIIEILNKINGDTTICGSAAIDLLASGASSYVWSTTETTNPISVATTGTYSVTGTDAFGCVNSTLINVSAAPGPVIGQIFGTPTICNGYQTQLSIDSTSGYTYSWVNNIGSVLSTDTIVTIATAGTYSLTVTNSCGSTTTPITIGSASISISFEADTTIGIAPLQVQFTNTSSGANSYYWLFGNGDTLATTVYNPVADLNQYYTTPGTYTAYLLGVNSLNYCSNSTTVEIIVLAQEIAVVVPNVFSPNGDDLNDFFGVKSYGINEFSCAIFNRWGSHVADLKSVTDKWTPSPDVSEGTYFYIMKAKGIDGKDYSNEGYVLLVK
ncbi:MAG: gliding motility-associated C-terminal domain-containing protein [Bacteroidota bacterium]|nr:gliding motility-associated C-terminal domain-containing protein [Bacteroidota bacterium]